MVPLLLLLLAVPILLTAAAALIGDSGGGGEQRQHKRVAPDGAGEVGIENAEELVKGTHKRNRLGGKVTTSAAASGVLMR